ncbi:MAG: riboflavin synthase [Bdellovibrionales bacterium]
MFTGIIADIGTVASIYKKGDWIVEITAPKMLKGMVLGASVACAGICLTVIEMMPKGFKVQLSTETVSVTTAKGWDVGTRINLERALCAGDELGGHIVTGHVDGLAKIIAITPEKDSLRFSFEVPDALAPFIASKGSVALDGISLTVNEVDGAQFGVNVIPFTQEKTTLGAAKAGDILNCEVDLMARYVARQLGHPHKQDSLACK